MQIISLGDNLHEMSNPYFLGKIRNYYQFSVSLIYLLIMFFGFFLFVCLNMNAPSALIQF